MDLIFAGRFESGSALKVVFAANPSVINRPCRDDSHPALCL